MCVFKQNYIKHLVCKCVWKIKIAVQTVRTELWFYQSLYCILKICVFVNCYIFRPHVLKLVNETNTKIDMRFIFTIIEILDEVVHIRTGTIFNLKGWKCILGKKKIREKKELGAKPVGSQTFYTGFSGPVQGIIPSKERRETK